jgi:hypothetical protein
MTYTHAKQQSAICPFLYVFIRPTYIHLYPSLGTAHCAGFSCTPPRYTPVSRLWWIVCLRSREILANRLLGNSVARQVQLPVKSCVASRDRLPGNGVRYPEVASLSGRGGNVGRRGVPLALLASVECRTESSVSCEVRGRRSDSGQARQGESGAVGRGRWSLVRSRVGSMTLVASTIT